MFLFVTGKIKIALPSIRRAAIALHPHPSLAREPLLRLTTFAENQIAETHE